MTLGQFFDWLCGSKHKKFFDENKREVEDLVGYHLGLSWGQLKLQSNKTIIAEVLELIKRDIEKIQAGLPLAHLTGEKFFYKNAFQVTHNVLIPRPETELLVEEALKVIGNQRLQVMDLGAGSGCIGLSVSLEAPTSEIVLIEASEAALKVCKKNAKNLQANNVEMLLGEVGDIRFLLKDKVGTIDLILSNPPYIAKDDLRVDTRVHHYEPHQALYADDNGLFWIHKFLLWGYDYLKEGGIFMMEFGRDQHKEVRNLSEKMDYQFVDFIEDYSGKPRFIKLLK